MAARRGSSKHFFVLRGQCVPPRGGAAGRDTKHQMGTARLPRSIGAIVSASPSVLAAVGAVTLVAPALPRYVSVTGACGRAYRGGCCHVTHAKTDRMFPAKSWA